MRSTNQTIREIGSLLAFGVGLTGLLQLFSTLGQVLLVMESNGMMGGTRQIEG